jgi:hypothetical protein
MSAWRDALNDDWYGSLPEEQRRVVDAYDAVNEAFWSHPCVVALREAHHASLCDCGDLSIEQVNRSSITRKVADMALLFHQAKQAMVAAVPTHPLALVVAYQRYPASLTPEAMSTSQSMALLAQVAAKLRSNARVPRLGGHVWDGMAWRLSKPSKSA